MSLRAFGSRLFKHGTFIVRSLYKRKFQANTIAEPIAPVKKELTVAHQPNVIRNFALRNVGLHARRILVDNVLNRVTNSLAADLRKRAARRMLFGDSGPFFALVGVSLASGTGILTKEEELEGICLEIREAVSKVKWIQNDAETDETTVESEVSLKNFQFDKPIAKGCSAIVYSARVKTSTQITNESKEVSFNFPDPTSGYPLAIKIMFNYDVQSNAIAILRAMKREIVPARRIHNLFELEKNFIRLPSHPNIACMYSVFADQMPDLKECLGLCPDALPERINPTGSGRNMSLFLIMRRYNCNLADFLATGKPSTRVSLLLLAQLLEAVSFMNQNDVAHRDLKSNNILLDLQENEAPILVVTDFGCCLADKNNGLYLPYTSNDVDKGGNTALMAPEVICAQPGTFMKINYTKSDLWAVGAIAYEIFGANNPFYGDSKLKSSTYKEDELPPMSSDTPVIIQHLVKNLLQRNPKKRLDAATAATICQVLLWAPHSWQNWQGYSHNLSSNELLQWLLCLTTKILCEGCNFQPSPQSGRRTYPEYLLIASLLRRAKLATIKKAIEFIQNYNLQIEKSKHAEMVNISF